MSDSHRLEGKVALVTGAAQGLGADIARVLGRRGARVVLADIVGEAADAVASEIDGAIAVTLDVSDERQWIACIDDIVARRGGIDIVVNNAGIFLPGSVEDTEARDMERFFRVNQLGVFLGMKSTVPHLKRRGEGAIVNISSCVAMRGVTNQIGYAATKWAVRGMTKCAALELAASKIRVNSVHPGPSETSMMAQWSDETRAQIRSLIPLGRFGLPSETAEAVAFLASDAASYISGAELSVDGAVFA